MSNRPLKPKKKVVVEDEQEDIEYRPPGRTTRDLIVQIGVTILILSFVLAPMLVFVFGETPAPVAPQEMQQQADDTEQQIQHFSAELAKNPDDPANLANLAFYTTQKALRLPPTPESETQKMTLLKEAEGNFRKALEKDPKYGFAQAELAKNLIVQQNYEEAGTFIEQAMKDADESMASSEEKTAAEGRSRKVQLLGLSSIMAAEKKDMPGAIAILDQAIELEPGNAQLYKQRAFMHLSGDDKEAAKKDLTIMVDIGQKSGDQNAAMEGQMLLQMLEQPAPTASPAADAAPAASATP
jgi:tetratricopeptide (TPR) repeat protein